MYSTIVPDSGGAAAGKVEARAHGFGEAFMVHFFEAVHVGREIHACTVLGLFSRKEGGWLGKERGGGGGTVLDTEGFPYRDKKIRKQARG